MITNRAFFASRMMAQMQYLDIKNKCYFDIS